MTKKIFSSTKEPQEFSTSSLTPELSQVQLWLNQVYPKEQRSQIRHLEMSGERLQGSLDLTDFVSLEELYCYNNQLTEIKFADSSLNKLRVLHVGDNNFPEQDLSLFSCFVALEVLNLGNNNFVGSLQPLQDLVNLRSLDISDTNIDDGLTYLPKKLKSLFCQAEEKVKCQKIREELKNHHLSHDCYDFQAWRKVENLSMMPGAWPKDNVNEESNHGSLNNLEIESPIFALVNDIYQDLIFIERAEYNTLPIKKNLEKFKNAMEEMEEGKSNFDSFKSKFRFDPQDLALVAGRYILAKEKTDVLEEETKKLRQNNVRLTKEKDKLQNENFQKLKEQREEIVKLEEEKNDLEQTIELQEKLRNTQDEINNVNEGKVKELKKQKEKIIKEWKEEKEALQTELTEKSEEIISLKKKLEILKLNKLKNLYYKNNNKIITDMTSNNNKNNKIFILEWKEKGLKDGTMPYEKFEVIAGSDKENLVFYSTFFDDNIKFKKGEIYELSITGNFVQDSSEIIQGVDSSDYELEKVTPSLTIKELWEENEEKNKKLDSLEKELEKKKEDASKINQEWINAKEEMANLQKQLENLRLESEKVESEKNEMIIKWTTPENHEKILQEQENLKCQLKNERRNKQVLTIELEKILDQNLDETIQTKLQKKQKEREQLKISLNEKLDVAQQVYLKMLLTSQEQLDGLIFGGVEERFRAPTKNQLQQAKDELISKISSEEIEELCGIQTEITKLEEQQKQWKKFEQYEEWQEVPPK